MSRSDRHVFRRRVWELETALFSGQAVSEADVQAALGDLVPRLPDWLAAEAREHAGALARLARGAMLRSEYRDRFGVRGIRAFRTSGGVALYRVPIETFPDHVNELALILRQGRAYLFDAGSPMPSTEQDLASASRVLAEAFGEREAFERVREVIVSHGHADHFGGVWRFKQHGARIAVHELDARVLTRYEERIVVAAADLRVFLRRAGVDDALREDLLAMYTAAKSAFRSVAVDRVVGDGESIDGFIAHHAPGHCPGQICLQVDNVLLTADHVIARITPHLSPESITPSTGLEHYLASLDKVRRVPGIDLALPGHEAPVPYLAQRIREIETHHHERLARVLASCATPRTTAEVCAGLFGAQQGYGRLMALMEAGAHIEYLSRRGRLEIDNLEDFAREPNPVVRYRAAGSS